MRSTAVVFFAILALAAKPSAALPALLAQDSVTVLATVSSDRVSVGEPFVLQIAVQTDGPTPRRVETPALPTGLEVVRTQDFSEMQFSYPGGRQRRYRREIILVARAPGQYVLPAARIDVEGRSYSTQTLSIVVESARAGTRGGVFEAGTPRLHAAALPDTVYVGQQSLLRLEALLPDGARPRRARPPLFDAPTPAGIWAQEVPQSRQSTMRLIGASVVEVHEFSRALFPLVAGSIMLPPPSVVYDAVLGVFGGAQPQRVAGDSLRLTVLPLPDAGRPAGFRGAVGRYALTATLEPRSVRAGDPATLTVEIRGEGNVKGLPPPLLPAISAADLLDAPEESETWASDGVIHGARRFRWFIVPAAEGTLEIGSIGYAFFDPIERRYRELATEPLLLHVTPGAGTTNTARRGAASEQASSIRREPGSEALVWVRSRWFAAMQVLPLLGLAALLYHRRSGPRPDPGATRARRTPRTHTARFTEAGADAATLQRAFTGELATLLGTHPAALGDAPALRTAFAARALPDSVSDRCADLLDRLAAHRFGGAEWDPATAGSTVADAESALAAVEAAVGDRSGMAGRALAVVVLGAALASAAAPALHAAGQEFAAGVAAFDGGDAPAAARHFAAHTRAHPRDAAGWYNLGSARAAAGDTGLAVSAWLEAARLQPRAGDVRARLDASGAGAARRALAPPAPLAFEEAMLVVAGSWWLFVGGIALFRLGRRSTGATLAGTAFLALLLVAGNWLLHTRRTAGIAVSVDTPALLRAAPALHAESLGELPPFAPLRVVERRGGWLRVRGNTGQGWIETPPRPAG